MRRAAISIPFNIAEGFKKRSLRGKINFYNIAQGSVEEVRYYLILSKDLNYLQEKLDPFWVKINEISKMLTGLVGSIAQSQNK